MPDHSHQDVLSVPSDSSTSCQVQEVHTMQRPTQPSQRRHFRISKLERRIAPAIVKVNGGGHTPGGQANGVPNENPSGFAPPGQNK
jgi:hypothetical protein